MTDLRKWSENAFVMLAGLKESVQWELAPAIMKEIRELVDAYPVGAAPSEGMKADSNLPPEKMTAHNGVAVGLSPARSGEPSAPQTPTVTKQAATCNCYGNDIPHTHAAPQTSAETQLCKCGHHWRKHRYSEFWCDSCECKKFAAAPQPVSGDAPPKCPNEILRELMQELHYTLDMGGKLSLPTQIKMQQADIYLNKLAGDAPKVEEIRVLAANMYGIMRRGMQGLSMKTDIPAWIETGRSTQEHWKTMALYALEALALRPYFPPASQTPLPLEKQLFVDQIYNALSKLESQVYRNPELPLVCKDIVRDGFDAIRNIEKLLATPASTARTDAELQTLWAELKPHVWERKYDTGRDIETEFERAVMRLGKYIESLPAAPGSVPQTPDSPNKPHCQNCGCNHFRGENTLCNDGVPQAEPPKKFIREVTRFEDMSPDGRLWLFREDDGDIIVTAIPPSTDKRPHVSVQFCTYSGGGQSQKTLQALYRLMEAMDADNKEREQGRGAAQPGDDKPEGK